MLKIQNNKSRRRKQAIVAPLLGALALLLTLLLTACSSAGSGSSSDGSTGGTGAETIKWEVTGQATGGSVQGNRFSIVWRIDYPNGGHEENSVSTLADDIPPWTKEETLEPGSKASLSISPIPDTVEPEETFTLDLEIALYTDGNEVASDLVNQTITPSYSNGNIPAPPISYTVQD